jgi:large subunit ribosomal protein L17
MQLFRYYVVCIFALLLAIARGFHLHRPSGVREQLATVRQRNQLEMISHRMGFNRLSRPADQRKALLRGLTTELLRHGRIKTTVVRAKALRKPVDHMITLAKRGTLHARRQALAYIYDKSLVASIFKEVPERYGDRHGGYCRVMKEKMRRRGDYAEMATIELV